MNGVKVLLAINKIGMQWTIVEIWVRPVQVPPKSACYSLLNRPSTGGFCMFLWLHMRFGANLVTVATCWSSIPMVTSRNRSIDSPHASPVRCAPDTPVRRGGFPRSKSETKLRNPGAFRAQKTAEIPGASQVKNRCGEKRSASCSQIIIKM